MSDDLLASGQRTPGDERTLTEDCNLHGTVSTALSNSDIPSSAPIQDAPTGKKGNEQVNICAFETPYDPENPFDWSPLKKVRVIVLALAFALLTGLDIGMYAAQEEYIRPVLGCGPIAFRLGITTFALAIALAPLLMAPFSEIYGRRHFYWVSCLIYSLTHFVQIYPHSLATLLVVRFIAGFVGAVGNTLVAGSIADIYRANERGWLMASFALMVFGMVAIGPYLGAVICQNLGWQWVGWLSIIFISANALAEALFMPETRGNVVLHRRKLRLERETGQKWVAAGELERAQSWANIVKNSLTRPVYFLTHEPIVIAFSLWLFFLWGTLFLLLESVPLVMAQFDLTYVQQRMAFLAILVGATASCAAGYHQEYLYQRDQRKADEAGERVKPESRLYHAMIGGMLFPVGALIFAWTGRPLYSWVGPCVGLGVMAAAIYPAYQAIFSYLADVYETYSSSALASQSLLRNIGVSTFVLFSEPLYQHFPPSSSTTGLGYAFASTMLAAIGALLGLVPFILFTKGETLRKRSKIASRLAGVSEGAKREGEKVANESAA